MCYHYANINQNGSKLLPLVEVLLITNLPFWRMIFLPITKKEKKKRKMRISNIGFGRNLKPEWEAYKEATQAHSSSRYLQEIVTSFTINWWSKFYFKIYPLPSLPIKVVVFLIYLLRVHLQQLLGSTNKHIHFFKNASTKRLDSFCSY